MPSRRLSLFAIPLILAAAAVAWLLADAPPTASPTASPPAVREDAAGEAVPSGGGPAFATPASRPPQEPILAGAPDARPARRRAGRARRVSSPADPVDRPAILGLVVDARGRPLPGALVFVENTEGRWVRGPNGRRLRATTSATGRYRLVTPTAGRYAVVSERNGYGTARSELFEVGGTTAPTEAPVLRVRGVGTFSGRVVFPDGGPVSGVGVRGYVDLRRGGSWGRSPHPGHVSMRTRTDAAGRFRIAGLRPGPYTVEVEGAEAEPRFLHAVCGAEDLRFVLRERQLRVLVRDASGKRATRADLARYDPASESWSCGRVEGERCFYGDGGERYVLCAQSRTCLSSEREVAIPTDRWTETVALRLRPRPADAGRLRLRVAGPHGEVVRALRVAVRAPRTGVSPPWLTQIRPDADGWVDGVPPGPWRVVVSPVDTEEEAPLFLFPAQVEVEVKAHEAKVVDVRCRSGGRILVTSLWPEGLEPDVTKCDIDLEGPVRAPLHRLWPDPEEPRLSPILEPGRWTIVATGEGIETLRLPVDVHPERVARVELRLCRRR